MSHLQLYRDDLLNRFANHDFNETAINSMINVDFENQDVIDSVSDSSGTARFNYASGPTLAVNDLVRVYGFSTNTDYNQTGIVTATDGTTYFEISGVSFGTDETGNLGQIVFSAKKLDATDAYKNIHYNMVGTFAEALPRLTTTQRDTLVNIDDALQFFDITAGEVQVHYEGNFEIVGGGEWKTRSAQTIQTTDTTVTVIDSLTLDEDETYLVQVAIVGVKSDGTDHAGCIKACVVHNDSGVATIVGFVDIQLESKDDVLWNMDLDVSGVTVRAIVKGKAATTVDWKCTMQFIKQ